MRKHHRARAGDLERRAFLRFYAEKAQNVRRLLKAYDIDCENSENPEILIEKSRMQFREQGIQNNEEDEKQHELERILERMVKTSYEFLEAAEQGNAEKVNALLKSGFPVNFQDPQTGETALHAAAACRARGVLRILVKDSDCDYLLRDKRGRLPSEMAYLYGHDPAAARLLGIKERKQGEAQGIKVTRRPPQPAQ